MDRFSRCPKGKSGELVRSTVGGSAGSNRANPTAEESAQEHRRNQDDQAPEQTFIEAMSGQRVCKADEGIETEEEASRIRQAYITGRGADRTAEFRPYKKEDKKCKEKDLGNQPKPCGTNAHESPFPGHRAVEITPSTSDKEDVAMARIHVVRNSFALAVIEVTTLCAPRFVAL